MNKITKKIVGIMTVLMCVILGSNSYTYCAMTVEESVTGDAVETWYEFSINSKEMIRTTHKGIDLIELKHAPLLISAACFVPAREFAVLLGADIEYDNTTKNITINGEKFNKLNEYKKLKEVNYYCTIDGTTYIRLSEMTRITFYNVEWRYGVIQIANTAISQTTEKAKELYAEINEAPSDALIRSQFKIEPNYCVDPYKVYGYDQMKIDLNELVEMYPELINVSSIGSSVEGRDLPLVEFGKGGRKILIIGSVHAREYIGTNYIMNFIDRYAYSYEKDMAVEGFDIHNILDNVTFCIVPMLNPDGVNIVQNGFESSKNSEKLKAMLRVNGANTYANKAWKANANGVDLNRNFEQGFYNSTSTNVFAPASANYRGPYAQSEPEIRALLQYIEANKFEAGATFHTQGQLLYMLYPNQQARNIGNRLIKSTGYTYVKEEGNSHGTFGDYVEAKMPNMFYACVELCPYIGTFPYPERNFNSVWDKAKNICLIMADEVLKTSTT